MNYRALKILILLLVLPAIAGAQKLEIVESDLLPLDTAKAVSLEFYYGGITINDFPNEALFLRANRGNEAVTKAYLSARDSLNSKAFLQGYASVADSTVPELQNDNKEVAMHLIIKTVHWQTSLDKCPTGSCGFRIYSCGQSGTEVAARSLLYAQGDGLIYPGPGKKYEPRLFLRRTVLCQGYSKLRAGGVVYEFDKRKRSVFDTRFLSSERLSPSCFSSKKPL